MRRPDLPFDAKRLSERIIFVDSFISDRSATQAVAELLFCDREKPGAEIDMIIKSQGGLVYAAMAIFDTMKKVKSPIRTIGVGWVGGIAILLLVAGYKGQRYVVPSCRICISPDPNESNLPILASTPFDDVIRETHAHLMQHTSITEQDLLRLEKRPLTPLEAIELGFADHLMESDFLEV